MQNYVSALKLILGRPVTSDDFTVSLPFMLLGLGVSIATFALFDYWLQEPIIFQNLYGCALLGAFYFCATLLAIVVCHIEDDYHQLPMLLTIMLSLGLWLAIIVSVFPFEFAMQNQSTALPLLALAFGIYAMIRAIAVTFFYPKWLSHCVASVFIIFIATFSWQRMYFPQTFSSYEPVLEEQLPAIDVEYVFYQQQLLLEQKFAKLKPGLQGEREYFFVGFGGSDRQTVFESETKFTHDVMQQHFDTGERSVYLYNNKEQLEQQPLANKYNLASTLKEIGNRMNADEDVLILLLTSHGDEESDLEVQLADFPLRFFSATDLRGYLDDAHIKWRIVIVSACYSGTFIEPLANDNTLIITASAKDRNSFGCSSERELTVFGDAFLKRSLAQSGDWIAAFENARRLVAKWENEFDLPFSSPKIFVGSDIKRMLNLKEPVIEEFSRDSEGGLEIEPENSTADH